jgi:DNA-binding response OmpR family regulator
MNILLIEDNPVILKLMEYTCEYEKHKCMSAGTGTDGLRLLRQVPFDLVISDENIPGIRGHQIAQWMRQDNHYKEVPMILISIEKDHKLYAELSAIGSINMFIPKPFTTKQLTSALNLVKLVKFPLKAEANPIAINTKSIDLARQNERVFQ